MLKLPKDQKLKAELPGLETTRLLRGEGFRAEGQKL